MRWWPWRLLLLVAALRTCCEVAEAADVRGDGEEPRASPKGSLGLSGTIARALNRIRTSRRDVRLTDDLWFETLRSGTVDFDGNALKSPSTDLLRMTDAVFDTHRLSWHNVLQQGIDINVYKDREQRYVFNVTRNSDGENSQNPDTRTFGGGRRRLQLMMLPIMYKLGVITTLLTGLTVLSLKGVTIGVILLILTVTSVATKLSKFNHYAAAASSYGGPASLYAAADPFDRSSPPAAPHQLHDKNIHVHVHTGPGASVAHPSVYRGPGATAYEHPDDGGAYWNRAGDEYYDAAANRYSYSGGGDRRPSDGGVEATTAANGAYNRWLG